MKKLLSLLFPIKEPVSKLALSIATFTNESFMEQIQRQGRLNEYLMKARYEE